LLPKADTEQGNDLPQAGIGSPAPAQNAAEGSTLEFEQQAGLPPIFAPPETGAPSPTVPQYQPVIMPAQYAAPIVPNSAAGVAP
jgi:hypothetical protein